MNWSEIYFNCKFTGTSYPRIVKAIGTEFRAGVSIDTFSSNYGFIPPELMQGCYFEDTRMSETVFLHINFSGCSGTWLDYENALERKIIPEGNANAIIVNSSNFNDNLSQNATTVQLALEEINSLPMNLVKWHKVSTSQELYDAIIAKEEYIYCEDGTYNLTLTMNGDDQYLPFFRLHISGSHRENVVINSELSFRTDATSYGTINVNYTTEAGSDIITAVDGTSFLDFGSFEGKWVALDWNGPAVKILERIDEGHLRVNRVFNYDTNGVIYSNSILDIPNKFILENVTCNFSAEMFYENYYLPYEAIKLIKSKIECGSEVFYDGFGGILEIEESEIKTLGDSDFSYNPIKARRSKFINGNLNHSYFNEYECDDNTIFDDCIFVNIYISVMAGNGGVEIIENNCVYIKIRDFGNMINKIDGLKFIRNNPLNVIDFDNTAYVEVLDISYLEPEKEVWVSTSNGFQSALIGRIKNIRLKNNVEPYVVPGAFYFPLYNGLSIRGENMPVGKDNADGQGVVLARADKLFTSGAAASNIITTTETSFSAGDTTCTLDITYDLGLLSAGDILLKDAEIDEVFTVVSYDDTSKIVEFAPGLRMDSTEALSLRFYYTSIENFTLENVGLTATDTPLDTYSMSIIGFNGVTLKNINAMAGMIPFTCLFEIYYGANLTMENIYCPLHVLSMCGIEVRSVLNANIKNIFAAPGSPDPVGYSTYADRLCESFVNNVHFGGDFSGINSVFSNIYDENNVWLTLNNSLNCVLENSSSETLVSLSSNKNCIIDNVNFGEMGTADISNSENMIIRNCKGNASNVILDTGGIALNLQLTDNNFPNAEKLIIDTTDQLAIISPEVKYVELNIGNVTLTLRQGILNTRNSEITFFDNSASCGTNPVTIVADTTSNIFFGNNVSSSEYVLDQDSGIVTLKVINPNYILVTSKSSASSGGGGTAETTLTDTTNFTNILSTDNTSVQLALDTLDNHSHVTAEALLAAKEPTGFEILTDSSVSFINATRTFEIFPAIDDYTIWHKGNKFVKTGIDSLVVTNVDGVHFIYFDDVGVLQQSQTVWDLGEVVPVAVLYWNSGITTGYLMEERHGLSMDWATHKYLHSTIGTRYVSGFALSGYVLNSDSSNSVTVELSAGKIADEDLEHSITHDGSLTNPFSQYLTDPAQIPVWIREGANGVWREREFTDYLTVTAGTGRTAWNEFTGGIWTQTEVVNTNYVAYWIVATNMPLRPVKSIQGQRIDTSLANAQVNNKWDQMSLGDFPFPEVKLLYRVIFQTNNTYTNNHQLNQIVDVTDYRNVSPLPSGSYVATDHGTLSGLSDQDHPASSIFTTTTNFNGILTATETSVQLALDKLDDSHNICQVRSVSGSGNILATDNVIFVDTTFPVTLTLLTAAAVVGRRYVIKDNTGLAETNNITVDTEGSEMIDGTPNLIINVNYASVTLIFDGTAWNII